MKLLRFMSAAEAVKLMQGKKVVNRARHHEDNGQATNSVGFCFVIADDRMALDATAIYHSASMLSGVTIMDICLVAAVAERPRQFTETWGHYREGNLPELSTEKYSLRDFAEWKFYAPHDRSGLLPVFSGNWIQPTLVARAKTKEQNSVPILYCPCPCHKHRMDVKLDSAGCGITHNFRTGEPFEAKP